MHSDLLVYFLPLPLGSMLGSVDVCAGRKGALFIYFRVLP